MPTRPIDSSDHPASIKKAPARPSPVGSADACHDAMVRHYQRRRAQAGSHAPAVPPVADRGTPYGLQPQADSNIIYGADAIATTLFPKDYKLKPRRTRRRVYHLWAYYRDRNEKAGFFKLKGALCLSLTQWKKFHGLD